MKASGLGAVVLSVVLLAPVGAGSARPDTVFFEDLTFNEIRDAIGAGTSNVLIVTGGIGDIADGGTQLVAGTSTDIATYAADQIARAVGDALTAPVIAYAADGLVAVADDRGYAALIESAATSAKESGFRNIFLLGEAASSQAALKSVAVKLDAAWSGGGVRVQYVSDYAVKASVDQDRYLAETLRVRLTEPGQRERFVKTSEVLAINGQRMRLEKLEGSDAAVPAPQHGRALLAIKINAAVAQIRAFLGRTGAPPPPGGPTRTIAGPRVLPTPNPFTSRNPSRFLEDLTPTEIREAVAAGNTTAIVPTGGTEKNGFHMAMGKHNFHVRAGAEVMAKKLGNALVASVLQYVPEGQATRAAPGVLSCARDCFEPVVTAVARSLRAAGFKDVLLVGDNGGNQVSLSAVAARLNADWTGTGTQAYALTDFYDKGHEYQDAWFLGQFGWDESVVGSHAGIKDTSQLLYVKPEDVRLDRIADSFANKPESGISGDPTKATLEFGRVAIEFKANAAIAQYRALKTRPQEGEPSAGRGRR